MGQTPSINKDLFFNDVILVPKVQYFQHDQYEETYLVAEPLPYYIFLLIFLNYQVIILI